MFDRKFGIELEIVGINGRDAAAALRRAGFSCQFEGYNHDDHTDGAWKVVTDGSIEGIGCEVVSPILHGMDGLDEACLVAGILADKGATANRSCGFHVHFDASEMTVEQLRAIVNRYATFEEQIDRFLPPSRRANNNRFCKSLSALTPFAREAMRNAGTIRQLAQAQNGGDRYFKVNLQSLLRHHTIEFRQHSGTCDAWKIRNWVLFLDGFVTKATEPAHRDTQAHTSPDSLTGRLSKAYWTIAEHPRCTSAQYAEILGVTQGRFRAYVTSIRQLGIAIEFEGGVYWVARGVFAAAQMRPATESADTHDGTDTVFAGVPATVERFYAARAAAFAA